MDVKVLGAANEVGRSGFLVDCNGTNLLLDYGVMFGRRGTPSRYLLPELNNMMKNAKEIGFKQKVNVFCTFIFSLRLLDQK